jgi:hypothetical protein
LNSPAWYPPLLGALSAGVVALVNYWVQRWRYRVDRLAINIDGLCSEVNAAADLCSDYWRLDCRESEQQAEASKLEARILGRQTRIQVLLLALKTQDGKLDLSRVEAKIPALYDALTGGNFKGGSRLADEWRSLQVQGEAANLNGELRMALAARVKRWR